MNNKLLTVIHENNIDLATSEVTSKKHLEVHIAIFTTGIVAKLGTKGFTTLTALATFMNSNRECYITYEELAEILGVHPTIVNKNINSLLDVRVEGKPLVTRHKITKSNGEIYSYFKINPL